MPMLVSPPASPHIKLRQAHERCDLNELSTAGLEDLASDQAC